MRPYIISVLFGQIQLCIIEDRDFFIHGLVQIPILGSDDVFSWGVWVSLSPENFARASDLWNHDARVNEPAYFGWFSNSLPGYPETLNLKTMVHTRPVGQRPFIELEPTDHPLALEQRNGLTMDRIQRLAEGMFHRNLDVQHRFHG